MALEDYAKRFFCEEDYNCAEAVLKAINAYYHLDLSEDAVKLIGGFGAGMSCQRDCGALAAMIAAWGVLCIEEKAHKTAARRVECPQLVASFTQKLGGTTCGELRPRYFNKQERCLGPVLAACAAFQEVMQTHHPEIAHE